MAKYYIGDIHGCYRELMQLLELIAFNSSTDSLYFSGDLVNKGQYSHETMKFILNTKNVNSVLGNHDLHLLALATGHLPQHKKHNLEGILNSKERIDIIEWIRHRPMLIVNNNDILVHAGIYPTWTLDNAIEYAKELEQALQAPNWQDLMKVMYGDSPDAWDNNLVGWDRLRSIINIFTRMRYIDSKLKLDFTETGSNSSKESLKPWYEYSCNIEADKKVFFGHWASLQGKSNNKKFISIDGGCVWGGKLIAIRVEDQKIFEVPSQQ